MRNKLLSIVSLVIVASMVLAACAPKTVEVIKTVEVEKQVTQVVKETQIVEREGQTVVVTATPAPVVAADFKSKDPKTFVDTVIGDPETLDPAIDYENAGITIILNIYDNLITYNHEKPADFVPALATEVPTTANGGKSDRSHVVL